MEKSISLIKKKKKILHDIVSVWWGCLPFHRFRIVKGELL